MSDDAAVGCLGIFVLGIGVAVFFGWNHFRQLHQKTSSEIATLQAQNAALKVQVAKLKSDASPGSWILWRSITSLQNQFFGSAAKPLSAYPTKGTCLSAAQVWRVHGGKIISLDPYIIETATFRWTYECLPRGVSLYSSR